jgi:hypothetical protein
MMGGTRLAKVIRATRTYQPLLFWRIRRCPLL